jgi:hypothetical protein
LKSTVKTIARIPKCGPLCLFCFGTIRFAASIVFDLLVVFAYALATGVALLVNGFLLIVLLRKHDVV